MHTRLLALATCVEILKLSALIKLPVCARSPMRIGSPALAARVRACKRDEPTEPLTSQVVFHREGASFLTVYRLGCNLGKCTMHRMCCTRAAVLLYSKCSP